VKENGENANVTTKSDPELGRYVNKFRIFYTETHIEGGM
jgi:hypothetical protein